MSSSGFWWWWWWWRVTDGWLCLLPAKNGAREGGEEHAWPSFASRTRIGGGESGGGSRSRGGGGGGHSGSGSGGGSGESFSDIGWKVVDGAAAAAGTGSGDARGGGAGIKSTGVIFIRDLVYYFLLFSNPYVHGP
jgi:hypothetical protein